MVCAPVRRENPRALVRGLSSSRRTNHALSHLYHESKVDLAHYGVGKGFPLPYSRRGSGGLNPTASSAQLMKSGAHPSPFAALFFPNSKEVPIYC